MNQYIAGIAALVLSISAAHANTGFSLGSAADYAVLFEGGGHNALNFNNSSVTGNVGIGGTGIAQFNGPGSLTGNVDFYGADVGQYHNSGMAVSGSVNYGVNAVNNALAALNTLNSTLGGETGANVAINVSTGSPQTISAANGHLDASGNMVFNLTSVNFANGTLTIQGDGTHNVVLNVSQAAAFNGNIVLTGGLTASQVLFNMVGGSGLTGGPTLTISSNGDTAEGTFLDPNGTIQINNSVLDGYLYGGDTHDEAIVSGATINGPEYTVPDGGGTMLLLSATLGMLLVGRKLRF